MDYRISATNPRGPVAIGVVRPTAEAALEIARDYESKGYAVVITAPTGAVMTTAALRRAILGRG